MRNLPKPRKSRFHRLTVGLKVQSVLFCFCLQNLSVLLDSEHVSTKHHVFFKELRLLALCKGDADI